LLLEPRLGLGQVAPPLQQGPEVVLGGVMTSVGGVPEGMLGNGPVVVITNLPL
jgi:hypothetical protein